MKKVYRQTLWDHIHTKALGTPDMPTEAEAAAALSSLWYSQATHPDKMEFEWFCYAIRSCGTPMTSKIMMSRQSRVRWLHLIDNIIRIQREEEPVTPQQFASRYHVDSAILGSPVKVQPSFGRYELRPDGVYDYKTGLYYGQSFASFSHQGSRSSNDPTTESSSPPLQPDLKTLASFAALKIASAAPIGSESSGKRSNASGCQSCGNASNRGSSSASSSKHVAVEMLCAFALATLVCALVWVCISACRGSTAGVLSATSSAS